jgi:hypothetical protein
VASGIIYLIILGMWAAYFVPRWISSHAESSGKNAQKFHTAIRSVAATDDKKFMAEEKKAKYSQIRNRRIIFTSLLTILLGTIVSVAVGAFALPILAIPVSAILIYSVHLRRQVVQSQMKVRRLNALEKIAGASVINEPTEQIKISSREDFEDSYKEHWIPLLERTETTGVVIIPKESNRESWEPIAVPKPTYVNAPKAVVPKRVIDLTVPGAWLESQNIPAEDILSNDGFFDQVVAEEISGNRAVNE